MWIDRSRGIDILRAKKRSSERMAMALRSRIDTRDRC